MSGPGSKRPSSEAIETPASEPAGQTRPTSPIGRTWIPFFALLAGFAVFFSILSQLRYEEFYAGNWDLGINMQLLWTNTHGHLLFDSGDYEFSQANSFLYIHSAYLAIPISYAYREAPTATTLFVLQALVVVSSATPILLSARERRVPDWAILCGIGLYFVSFPVISALLFDFHWEAFVPAELLWTYFLWNRRRYWWALVPAGLGLVTLEVFPFLILGLVLYFGYPRLVGLVRGSQGLIGRFRIELRRSVPVLCLLLFAVVGYLAIYSIGTYILPLVAGPAPTFPAQTAPSFLSFYLWGVSGSTVGSRLLYWSLLLASFGFLPLFFRQRLLLLSLPWFVYSVVMSPYGSYTLFGFQYPFLAVGPLALGFVEALGELYCRLSSSRSQLARWVWLALPLPFLVAALADARALLVSDPLGLLVGLVLVLTVMAAYLSLRLIGRRSESPNISDHSRTSPSRVARDSGVAAVVVIVLLVGAGNLVFSPLNPGNFVGPGEAGYSFTYSPSPLYGHMAAVTAEIPSGASVVASDNLFPFVANNPRAFSLRWTPEAPPIFPFNSTHLPDDVLLSTSQWFVPGFLNSALQNSSLYGLSTVLYSTSWYPGSVFLFQRDFTGVPVVIEVSPYLNHRVICPSELALGPSGRVSPEANTPCGEVVRSEPAANLSGNGPTIWYGPYITLLPGNYSITFLLRGETSDGETPGSSILVMDGSESGGPYWYYLPIGSDTVSPTAWTNITLRFNVTAPAPNAEFRGYLGGVIVDGQFTPGNISLAEIVVNRI